LLRESRGTQERVSSRQEGDKLPKKGLEGTITLVNLPHPTPERIRKSSDLR